LTPAAWALVAVRAACRPGAREREPDVREVVTTPNVVVVTIDTLRADHTSAYGYDRPTTPNLQALAAEGTLFRSAYAVTATTLPSHATLFTSLYPSEHGVLKNGIPLRESFTTLAEILRAHRWQTAAFVSSFPVHGQFGLQQGFDVYDDDFRGADATVARSEQAWEGHQVAGPFDRRAEDTTKRAIDWLRTRDPARPFLLWVHLFDPHAPYDPPQSFRSRFLRSPEASVRERDVDLYDAEVAYADRELGRLLHAVDRASPRERTLTLVTSDHGEGLWDHGWRGHGVYLYEEAVRVPLVVRWPGRIPEGRKLDGPVGLVDVLPTLLTLIGVERDGAPMRGTDLTDALEGRDALDPGRPIYFQRRLYHTPEWKGVRVSGAKWGVLWRGWKLIHAPEEATELYDLRTDPHELLDLAPERSPVVLTLSERLSAWEGGGPNAMQVTAERPSEEVQERLRALGYVD
jgi:arylsulfatase A-like enzyme